MLPTVTSIIVIIGVISVVHHFVPDNHHQHQETENYDVDDEMRGKLQEEERKIATRSENRKNEEKEKMIISF